jgi:malate synthase
LSPSVTVTVMLENPCWPGVGVTVTVGIRYLAAWLCGSGCVPIFHLMEDAATAEISRTQVWQWVRHGAQLADGRVVSGEWFRTVLAEEVAGLRAELGEEVFSSGRYAEAADLFERMATQEPLVEFLTVAAYGSLQ